MLTAVQRIRVYMLAIILVIAVLSVMFYVSAARKRADILLLNRVRGFSYALEQHKVLLLRYPESKGADLRQPFILTDLGFKAGAEELFRGPIRSRRAVVYQSDGQTYHITFRLYTAWPKQGLDGTRCAIRELYQLTCTP